jgi:cell division protein FtsL
VSGRLLLIAGLAMLVLASAIGTAWVQHQRRALFVELQRLERERDALRVHWGRLQLEHSTWSTHERVERIATESLGLRPPPAESVVLVTTR